MIAWRLAATASILVLVSCSASDGASRPERAAATSTSTARSTSTTGAQGTTTTALRPSAELPPSVAVDGDPGSGNLTDQSTGWLDMAVDDSTVPHHLLARNRSGMPIDLAVSFTESVNVTSQPAMPARVVVPPLQTVVVATIGPDRDGESWNYRYATNWLLGDPAATADPVVYPHPLLADGTPAPIVQGPGGAFSHTDAVNQEAYDFAMPIGTPVVAARAGTVATIDQGFTEHGTDADLANRGNSIRVLHSDGSWAVYLHLDPRSARVRIGDRVEAGQILALSGNTGRSKAPHLHLAIIANRDHVDESVPFELQGS